MPLEILARSLSTLPAPAQCVLEEMAGREAELGALREKAHHLWEGQAAGKGFVHRVSQLSAQYLALSNLTKVTPAPSSCYNPPPPPPPSLCAFHCVPGNGAFGGRDDVTGNVMDGLECRKVTRSVHHLSPVEAVL